MSDNEVFAPDRPRNPFAGGQEGATRPYHHWVPWPPLSSRGRWASFRRRSCWRG
jgi:hypothetical protein